MTRTRNTQWTLGIFIFFGISIMLTASAQGEKLWLDELKDSVIFYQAHYPEGNWSPYIEKLTLVKTGVYRGDQELIKTAMKDFLVMLQSGAYGINGIAAHALRWLALGLQPGDANIVSAHHASVVASVDTR